MKELVVLLDDTGAAIGTADKAGVHHTETPLHLAFSCYIFDASGRVLLTRRAWSKPTWPGVWTNSVCGHPGPDEDLADAVRRRARDELGLVLTGLRLVLPDFGYRAVMADGVVENERCPVFVARAAGDLDPDPAEVAEVSWVAIATLRADLRDGRQPISPWAADQLALLPPDPLTAPDGDPARLPPAARLSSGPGRGAAAR